MTVQTRSVAGAGAVDLGVYFAPALAFGSYMEDPGPAGRRHTPGPDAVVWEAHEVFGSAAERMGIGPGEGVSIEALGRLMVGQHAKTGEQLTRQRAAPVYERDASGRYLKDADGNKIRTLDADGKPVSDISHSTQGIETVTAAPKCVGIASIVFPHLRPQIDAVLHRANMAVINHVETRVGLGRRAVSVPVDAPPPAADGEGTVLTKPQTRQQGTRTERVPVQLTALIKRQHMARPTAESVARGGPPDVHLHTHIFFPRSGFEPETQKWLTVDEYALLEATKATEVAAIHDAEVHRGLVDLGFEMDYGNFDNDANGRRTWRIKDIPPEAEAFFSTNHERLPQVVRAWEQETGRVASRAMQNKLMHDTKLPKDLATALQDVNPDWSRWTEVAAAHGIPLATEELVDAMAQTERPIHRRSYEERKAELWRSLFDSPNGLTRNQATFTAPEALSSVARAAEGLDFSPDELDLLGVEVLDQTVALDPLNPDGTHKDHDKIRRTTRAQLDAEHRIKMALHSKATQDSLASVSPATFQATIAAAEHPLDGEQLQVFAAVTSHRGLVVVEGDAGTGKTTVLRPSLDALRRDGLVDQVIVVSTASRTARETGRKLAAEVAGPFESITTRIASGEVKINSRTAVVVDESAMVDTRRMDSLSQVLGDARLVLVGDPQQSRAIGPAGWYQDATDENAASLHRLTNVHRYRDPQDALATRALREGRSDDALDSFERRGRLHISETAQDSLDRVVRDNRGFRNRGYSAQDVRILHAGGANKDLDISNRAIQADRIAHGEIPARGFEMEESSTGRGWNLHTGDPVIFIDTYRGATAEDRVSNGLGGLTRSVDPDTGRAVIDLDDGRSVNLALTHSATTQPVAAAYAVHSMKFQGGQTKVTQEVLPPPERADKHAVYTGTTRAEHETHIYLDRETHGEQAKENMAEALRSAVEPVSALSVGRENDYQPRHASTEAPTEAPVRAETPYQPRHARPETPAQTTPTPTSERSARSTVIAANAAAADHGARLEDEAARALAPVREEMRDEMRKKAIAVVRGDGAAERVQQSPGWSRLSTSLNQLEADGFDERAMLKNAAREGDFTGANDYALVLDARLATTPKIERTPPPAPRIEEPQDPYLKSWVDRGPEPRRVGLSAETATELDRAARNGRRRPPPMEVDAEPARTRSAPPMEGDEVSEAFARQGPAARHRQPPPMERRGETGPRRGSREDVTQHREALARSRSEAAQARREQRTQTDGTGRTI